jgi:GNAT superfamily N-acetyltransferase
LTISDIRFAGPHAELTAVELLDLSIRSWGRGTEEMIPALEYAIGCTQNFTARSNKTLVGCARLLSDGFFATVPEILVDRAFQGRGIGRALMSELARHAPTRLGFGIQPGNELFFEKCGFVRSRLAWFERRRD